MTRYWVLVSLLGLIEVGAACATRGPQTPWAYDDHVGVVIATADQVCLATKARSVTAQTRVSILVPGSADLRQAVVIAAADRCLDATDQGSGLHGYTMKFEGSSPPTPFEGVGLVGVSRHVRAADRSTIADIDGDGRDDFVRSCTSSEGVHFTIWSGAPLIGQRRWHQYHYLGYDVSPTCAPAETNPQ